MAFSKIVINFDEVPSVNEYLEFNETTTATNIKETFKVSRVLPKQCRLPNGVEAGPEGGPSLILWSYWVTEYYKQAFNLDYNVGGAYTITTANGPAGSGIGIVTITATFPGAVFEEINTPGGIVVTITNEDYVETIIVTDAVTEPNPAAACDSVLVNVTTNILAVKVLEPTVIDPNAANPFQLTVPRGTNVTIRVVDENDNENYSYYLAPALLEAEDFSAAVENDLEGATVTVSGAPVGLTLEYSLDGVAWQSSNVFTGLDADTYSLLVRDQYGCFIALAFTVEAVPTPLVLSRSPYFVDIEAPGVDFDAANMDLRVWAGDVVTDRPATPTYSLSKIAVQAGQPKIVFDIHHIINDFVKNRYTHFVQGQGAFTASSRDTVFVETNTTATYLGDTVGNDERRYVALDGFGWHTQGPNPAVTEKVLSSITRHLFYGDNCPIYFVTKGLTQIVVNGVNVPFTFSQSQNNQVIAYLNAAAYATDNAPFMAVFVYGATRIKHTFQKLSECKYQVATCYFKNKFGVWETIPFSKKSKKGLDVTSSDYESVIADFGSYDLTQHVNRTFNVELGQRVTVNTDLIPESYNALFRELMASEFIYLHQGGQVLPVNRAKNTWDEKTRTNDKLIQYAMEFKYSFNEINQVQ